MADVRESAIHNSRFLFLFFTASQVLSEAIPDADHSQALEKKVMWLDEEGRSRKEVG